MALPENSLNRHFAVDTQLPGRLRPSLDSAFILALVGILLLGLVMVVSSSISFAEKQWHDPFYYLWRQLETMAIGLIFAAILSRIPLQVWQKFGPLMLAIAVLLLILIFIPGLGKTVNGSTRWLCMGDTCAQPSELLKLTFILYIAGYLVRHEKKLEENARYYLIPLVLLAGIACLLLLQPDLGVVIVILCITLGLLFLAGMPMRVFFVLLAPVLVLVTALVTFSDYRLQRLLSFVDPCGDDRAFTHGYQLCQSLIAFGRGGFSGVGLGGSVQKLFYLPEAHTDFVLAVLAEEIGLLGMILVLLLFAVLIYKITQIALRAHRAGLVFGAFVAHGIALWLAVQTLMNMGVNSGLLPTKGLTLPLMSYGGSSMVVTLMAMGLLLRIEKESQVLCGGSSREVV